MMMRIAFAAVLLLGTAGFAAEPSNEPSNELRDEFVIHEWGTFTVLQDAEGKTLSGVNVNEEPLPAFAHDLFPGVVKDGFRYFPSLGARSKGLPPRFASATMRLETPVIYLYPPNEKQSADETETIDIAVRFNGGWISEWFPQASVSAPGFDKSRRDLGVLNAETEGSISWNKVTVNSEGTPYPTKHHVWLAPREVSAPVLSVGDEAEKYLFYRGVANITAPLRVVQNEKTGDCQIFETAPESSSFASRKLWLVDISESGKVAYETVSVSAGTTNKTAEDRLIATAPFVFPEDRYTKGNLASLKEEMKSALIEEGLFEDEAVAMLKTWDLSYFQSTGTRLFFTLPREWTDEVLPMEVSQPAQIERVMIGRIEMLNNRQRELLSIINHGPTSNPDWFWLKIKSQDQLDTLDAELGEVANGTREASEVSLKVPADYAAYLQLGRFRDSIVANASTATGNEQIRKFTVNYRLLLR